MIISGQSITLANSIIGVGILAMPYCFQQCGVLLATLILVIMGLVSRLSSYYLLKAALIARRRNFEFLAFHVFGPAGKMAVEIGIIGFLMGSCIAYFVVVGDLGPQIIAKIFNINQSDVLRTSIMVIVSLVCVLPLGLLRNVDSLSNVSAATICFYFCLVIKIIAEATSQLFDDDWRNKMELWKPSGVLQCVPIFSMALFCQTQLFEVFDSMPVLSLEKMNLVTKNAINICSSVYITLGVFGYIAFSSQSISGNVLVSLSPTMASDIIKLGFVMSVACSFPLIIFPCRASLYSLMYRKAHPSHHDNIINHSIPEGTFRLITVSIVGLSLFFSLMLPNIELVLGLVGSTIGVLICVVFPAACFVNVTFKNTNERILAKVILVMGLVIMVLGTYATLEAAENKLDKFDDKHITQDRIDKIVEEYFRSKPDEQGEVLKAVRDLNKIKQDIQIDAGKDTKESEMQPPNPVPPESQSKEKLDQSVKHNNKKDIIIKDDNEINKLTERRPPLEINPKKSNNGSLQSNGQKREEQEKHDKLILEQDRLNMMKQEKLIETMKQHGEEQKELIKEQKEIWDEIFKHKDEIIKNDKERVNSNEAKIIAVESIQKIANMAIKSLSAVSEKPANVNNVQENKPKQNIEEIANVAVQEIAKKAVETMEAIKESEVKTKVGSLNNLKITNIAELSLANKSLNNIEMPNNILNSNNNMGLLAVNKSLSPVESRSHIKGVIQNLNKSNHHLKTNINNEINENLPIPLAIKPQTDLSQNSNSIKHKINNDIPSLPALLNIKPNIIYTQKENVANVANLQQNIIKTDESQNPDAKKVINENINNSRQKREVVDCKNKELNLEDGNLVVENVKKEDILHDNILPSLDLGELSLGVPIAAVHHVRSLKYYENEN